MLLPETFVWADGQRPSVKRPGSIDTWVRWHVFMEYDFVVSPGVDPSGITIRFDGAESIRLDERGDLVLSTPVPVMAARFHKGLAHVICRLVKQCSQCSDGQRRLQTVVLSGGVFQNQVLFELVKHTLETEGFMGLSHAQVPMNDGGLALGQAAIAAARYLQSNREGESRCV